MRRRKRTAGGKAGNQAGGQPGTARTRQVVEAALTDVEGAKAWARRVVDTVDLMHRRGHLTADERIAAGIYRDAWELCHGGLRSTLDAGPGRSGGVAAPAEARLAAARRLGEAGALLGAMDDRLVASIACEGLSVEEAAGALLGRGPDGKAKRADCEHVGRRFRLALAALAEAWRIGEYRREGRMRASAPAPTDCAGAGGEIERGRVAHVTARKVYDI